MNRKLFPLFLLLLLVGFSFWACRSSKLMTDADGNPMYRIAFYNVENLFDIIDDPNKADEEFTPESKKKWDQSRYDKKLADLGKVVAEMGYPALLGLCEVENRQVCVDFCESTLLAPHKYDVVHRESPDFRGIDVALMYQKKHFRPLGTELIRINFPKEIVEDYTTRDVLVVKGILGKKDTLHVFVNHWPSRRGGLEASQPKRVYVAEQVRKKMDDITSENPSANIILMGDFNDEPDNKSLSTALGAAMNLEEAKVTGYYNLMSKLDIAGEGSYNYRGNWNMLDQLIVSQALATGEHRLRFHDPVIFREEFIIYHDKKYGDKPSRTYGGPNYYGGFSDHFPVYVDMTVVK